MNATIDALEDIYNGLGLILDGLYRLREETKTITGTVYKLYNRNEPDQFYIGSTVKTLNRRLSSHKQDARSRNSKLYQYMREKGFENFTIEPIETVECKDMSALRELEQRYIINLRPTLNYQRAYGFDKRNWEHNWRQANANKYKCNCGYHTYLKPDLTKHLRRKPTHNQI